MRILLDESLPRRLKTEMTSHQVSTVCECGWAGIKNGKLLTLAAAQFDVFITADQNLPFQQNLKTLPIAVIVLIAPNNRLRTLTVLVPKLLNSLLTLKPCSLLQISS